MNCIHLKAEQRNTTVCCMQCKIIVEKNNIFKLMKWSRRHTHEWQSHLNHNRHIFKSLQSSIDWIPRFFFILSHDCDYFIFHPSSIFDLSYDYFTLNPVGYVWGTLSKCVAQTIPMKWFFIVSAACASLWLLILALYISPSHKKKTTLSMVYYFSCYFFLFFFFFSSRFFLTQVYGSRSVSLLSISKWRAYLHFRKCSVK